jgi:hypothetical protein
MLSKFCDLIYRAVAAAVAKGITDGVAQGVQTVTGEPITPAIEVDSKPAKPGKK